MWWAAPATGIAIRPTPTAREESHRVIVPKKRLNKGSILLAEGVEESDRSEGNSRQVAAIRTQSRRAASIRLAVVRRTMSASKPLTV